MMVETILESSQDFGMSNGALPQWKRELLQRRAARSRPPLAAVPSAPPPPPPPPAPVDEAEEELSYGPGIVKRLKSRYLSLALRDAPRRRPSVLRRATSLEHLLDERPPPAPRAAARAPRPASVAAPPAALAAPARRDFVKRARSVDALSRLDSREELALPSPSPPPPPPLAPRPPAPGPRSARPPRRPAPLLRDAERPPPDVVRSTLRKFESAPLRRAAPAARVSAVLRGLEGTRRSLTPEQEPDARTPSPQPASETPPPPTTPPPPPPQTPAPYLPLEPSPPASPTPSPVPTATVTAPPVFPTLPTTVEPVLVEIIEVKSVPESVSPVESAPSPPSSSPVPASAPATDEVEGCLRVVSRAALEGIARAGSSVRFAFGSGSVARGASHLPPLAATNPVLVASRAPRRVGVIRPMPAEPRARPVSPLVDKRLSPEPETLALVNGHSTPEPRVLSRIGAAGIERAWSGGHVKRIDPEPAPSPAPASGPERAPWARGPGGVRPRAPPPAATSVVFNFSNRKEVPDYIENDGLILRASRRNRIKAGEPGVVVLRPEAVERSDSESEIEDSGPPSPCGVRFVNDNVLINGKSSMPPRPDKERIAKLKLQFDDSLTRTFEYPSETSFCDDPPPSAPSTPAAPGAPSTPAPPAAPSPPAAPVPQDPPADTPATHLADNTHIASAALSRYTPHKTSAPPFLLGLTRQAPDIPTPTHKHTNGVKSSSECETEAEDGAGAGAGVEGGGGGGGEEERGGCGALVARSWSESRALATDLLF